MWLAVLGSSITPIESVSEGCIGITKYCIDAHLEPYVSAACFIPLVNDTFVFLATSRKIMEMSHTEQNIKNGARLYFLTTISLNLVTAALFNNTGIPVVYRSFVGVPNIVLMNAMACHVFRKIRLGVYRETTSLPTINPEAKGGLTNPISALIFGRNPGTTGISTDSSVNTTAQYIISNSAAAEKRLEHSETEVEGLATRIV